MSDEFTIEKSYKHETPMFDFPRFKFVTDPRKVTLVIHTPEVLPDEFYQDLTMLVTKYLPKDEH